MVFAPKYIVNIILARTVAEENPQIKVYIQISEQAAKANIHGEFDLLIGFKIKGKMAFKTK